MSLHLPCNFRGNVEYCLLLLLLVLVVEAVPFVEVFEVGGGGVEVGGINIGSKAIVTTTSLTRSPDLRIRATTVSWLACLTSWPLIWKFIYLLFARHFEMSQTGPFDILHFLALYHTSFVFQSEVWYYFLLKN